eukprot:TRINITY_DN5633_c0_g1_i1.p1 TRINITY_DN5633_c0_g1~~TRINITY_DN5633_c0_g1_i1.p1  ORF type:complete len:167 (+),score=38.43 TRINITY_DN5633_c0_g1_i1:136-636(+)
MSLLSLSARQAQTLLRVGFSRSFLASSVLLSTPSDFDPRKLTRSQWRSRLDPEVFRVVREKGTEPPFSSEFNNVKGPGEFSCVCCSQVLFSTDEKYDSGSGWPSFTGPVLESSLKTLKDNSHGMRRTEVLCKNCGAHLGHVFPDGPSKERPLRYCINGIALKFNPE